MKLEDKDITMAELELDNYMVDLGLGMSCLNIKDTPTLMDMDINWEEEELDRIVQSMETDNTATMPKDNNLRRLEEEP